MAGTKTLTIIKPDAFGAGKAGRSSHTSRRLDSRSSRRGFFGSPTLRQALFTRFTGSGLFSDR